MNDSVFGTFVRANNRFQRFQVCVKTLAFRIRHCFGFATLVIYLINVAPALFVPECHLRVIRGRIQVIYHVGHCRNYGFIG